MPSNLFSSYGTSHCGYAELNNMDFTRYLSAHGGRIMIRIGMELRLNAGEVQSGVVAEWFFAGVGSGTYAACGVGVPRLAIGSGRGSRNTPKWST